MSEQQKVKLRGLNVDWSDGRTEALLARVQTRLGRRRQALHAALALTALVCVVFGGGMLARLGGAPKATPSAIDLAARAEPPATIRLREGSEIRPASSASKVLVVEETALRVLVELVRGSARYSVVPNPARSFEVRSGSVTVKVVGTEFLVEQRAERTWVEVTRGKVRVISDNGTPDALLAAGESGLFPLAPASPAEVGGSESEIADPVAAPERASAAYRAHLAKKDYRAAFALLSRNPAVAGDSVQALLQAADVARLSQHPAEAVPYLQRIVGEHANDPRAPLAAFTLGRTLSGLGRTREALSMFARVRSAWANSPLAEDALVRQAEAAATLGEVATAVRLAESYDHDYPSGRRRAEMRRYARLE